MSVVGEEADLKEKLLEHVNRYRSSKADYDFYDEYYTGSLGKDPWYAERIEISRAQASPRDRITWESIQNLESARALSQQSLELARKRKEKAWGRVVENVVEAQRYVLHLAPHEDAATRLTSTTDFLEKMRVIDSFLESLENRIPATGAMGTDASGSSRNIVLDIAASLRKRLSISCKGTEIAK